MTSSQAQLRLASLVLLCAAVIFTIGEESVVSMALLLGALLLATVAPLPMLRSLRHPSIPVVLVALLATTAALYNFHAFRPVFVPVAIGVAAAAVLAMHASSASQRWLCIAFAAGCWLVGLVANFTWGFANIDVFHFQQLASAALLAGHNPYTPVSPAMVPVGLGVLAYAPWHFPYGPVIPLLEAPFRFLGDVRLLDVLAALATAAAVVRFGARQGARRQALALALAFPLSLGMVLFSWIDVITMAGVALWLLLMHRQPRVAVVVLAIALGGKPTTLIALLPILFWSVTARRQATLAAALALAMALPFALMTGVPQFLHDVIGVQLASLPRVDALTGNSLLYSLGLPLLPAVASALIIALTAVVVIRRRPRTLGDIMGASAVLTIVSFLVAKWAFFNYYYIAAVLLLLAVVTERVALDVPEAIRPPAVLVAIASAAQRIAGSTRPVQLPQHPAA